MDLGIRNRTALVLAASKGLGFASAMALAAEGVNVTIAARTAERLEQAAREIRTQTGAKVLTLATDVTDEAQCEALYRAAVAEFGGIDILVNNAGGPPFGLWEQFTDEQWRGAVELNLMSTVRFTRMVLPAMKEQRWGRILNIVSTSVKSALPLSMLSTAARLGVVGMSKMLADEVAQFNVTINNIAPGSILTDRVRSLGIAARVEKGMTEEQAIADIASGIPARRIGNPDELGALVAFLASDHAGYITGSTIPVDGGLVRSIS
jgi:3-oxoacyl-[acyl-carrier protein] reductase